MSRTQIRLNFALFIKLKMFFLNWTNISQTCFSTFAIREATSRLLQCIGGGSAGKQNQFGQFTVGFPCRQVGVNLSVDKVKNKVLEF